MISWNVPPAPPEIIGPWFLWKLIIDSRFQRSGYGRATVNLIAETVRAEGATALLTSYVEGENEPWPFRPTGDRDDNDEVILALKL